MDDTSFYITRPENKRGCTVMHRSFRYNIIATCTIRQHCSCPKKGTTDIATRIPPVFSVSLDG